MLSIPIQSIKQISIQVPERMIYGAERILYTVYKKNAARTAFSRRTLTLYSEPFVDSQSTARL